MIAKTALALLAYLCVAGFVADAQCNSTSCTGNQVCSGVTSFCNIGTTCSCSTGMKLNGSMCVTPTVSLNGSCASNADCKGVYTTCSSSGKCACTYSTYTAMSDGSDCVAPTPAPAIPLNNTCTVLGPSCGKNAGCTSGVCQCWASYTPIGGANNADCRPIKLNEVCSNVTDCPSTSTSRVCANANCNSGTLQCNNGYHWVNSETISFASTSFTGGCVPNNVTASVTAGQPCSDSQTGGSTYQLCANGLTCTICGGSYTCQNTVSTSTSSPSSTTIKNGVANVRLDMMALVSMLALAVLRFAA